MDKINENLEKFLMPIAGRIGSNKILLSVRDGIILAMPLIIIGSLFMIISSFPIASWENWLKETGYADYLINITNGSFGIVSLIASFGVASTMARQYNTDGVGAGIISLSSFIIATPDLIKSAGKDTLRGLPYSYVGSQGLFVAIIIGLVTGYVFQWFINHNIQIKMPDSVPPAVSRSFSSLIPGFCLLTFWGLIYLVLDFAGTNIHEIIIKVVGGPLSLLGATLGGTIVAIILNSLFWFVGINGGDAFNNILVPTWLQNSGANWTAFQAGTVASDLPHIVTYPFMYNFVYLGGGGATLGLVIVIALMARRKNASQVTKTMAPLTLVPGIFNINEPAIFGMPLVLNLQLLIPFVLAPVVNALIAYSAMATGIVPKTIGATIPWTMPPIISGFLATRSIRGSILQIVCIVLNIFIYYVFYSAYEKTLLKQENQANK
ncbi:PTS sugar transporter subunit IIC [Aerococcus urinae]